MLRVLFGLTSLLWAATAQAGLAPQRFSGKEAKLLRQALKELSTPELRAGAGHVMERASLSCRVDKFGNSVRYQCLAPALQGERARRVVQLLVESHVPGVMGWGVQSWDLHHVRCESRAHRTSCQMQT